MSSAANGVLLPYQRSWLEDKSQVKLFTKSRRIGITWAEAADAALACSSASGMDVTYICYDQDITREFIKTAADWAKHYQVAASEIDESIEVFRDKNEDKSITVFRIYFNTGFELQAIAGTPRKLRGRKGRIIIDEAAFLDDLGATIEAAMALLIWGGDLRIITTYNGIDNAYYELEQEVLAGKYPYSRHFCTFRDAIAQGLYQRICAVKGDPWTAEGQEKWIAEIYAMFGDRAAQELDCVPARSGGTYLSRAVIEQCMDNAIPVVRWELPQDFATQAEAVRVNLCDRWIEEYLEPLMWRLNPNLKSFFGMDFGRTGDLSVILPLQESLFLSQEAPFAIELRNCTYEQQKQILFWLTDRLPRFMAGAMDARGNGNYLAEVAMQRYGVSRIHRVQATSQWYQENFPRYKAALEDKKILLPLSSDWLDDHRMVIVDRGIPKVGDGKNKGADGKQRHGDSAIAGVLAWFATRNGGSPIEFERVTPARFGYGLDDYLGGRSYA